MDAAGVGSSAESSSLDSPCLLDEPSWYGPARESSPPNETATWDPYLLPDLTTDSSSEPSLLRLVQHGSESMRSNASSPDTAESKLLHILDTLDAKEYLPVSVPFELDLLTVQTCDASTLSHSLSACQVESETIYSVGFRLWKTQHVTDDPVSFTTQKAILQERLQGKSIGFQISFIRNLLCDAGSDLFHTEILSLLKHLIPASALSKKWKRFASP